MARGAKNYPIPNYLSSLNIQQEKFGEWLDKVTNAHVKRDKRRTKRIDIKREVYRKAIYQAVNNKGNNDYYTGESLDWHQLHLFSDFSTESKDDKRIPSVDHENLNPDAPIFRICSLRTNKCKSNYPVEQLMEFCETFIDYQKKTK